MNRVNFANTYKDVYISISAKNQLEDLVSSCNQGNLAFYSDIKVSLSRIAGGEYEGVKFVGNNTWRKDLEFGGGSYYLNLICDYTYRKVAFYVLKFEFNPQTTNRKLSLEEKNKHNTISITESEIRDMVRESVELILSEGHIYKPVAYNKTITLNNGVKQKALVTLSDGAGVYHIGIDDGCYVIHQEKEDGTMQDESTMYIFPELHKALKNLPNLPPQ